MQIFLPKNANYSAFSAVIQYVKGRFEAISVQLSAFRFFGPKLSKMNQNFFIKEQARSPND